MHGGLLILPLAVSDFSFWFLPLPFSLFCLLSCGFFSVVRFCVFARFYFCAYKNVFINLNVCMSQFRIKVKKFGFIWISINAEKLAEIIL